VISDNFTFNNVPHHYFRRHLNLSLCLSIIRPSNIVFILDVRLFLDHPFQLHCDLINSPLTIDSAPNVTSSLSLDHRFRPPWHFIIVPRPSIPPSMSLHPCPLNTIIHRPCVHRNFCFPCAQAASCSFMLWFYHRHCLPCQYLIASCVRSRSSNLSRIMLSVFRTVPSPINSCSPISLLDKP